MHPSEEARLVRETAVRRVVDARGKLAGQLPLIVPGSIEEREVLAAIEQARQEDTREPLRGAEARRRLRRHWREQRP